MWCPACSWLIGEVLRKTEGIVQSKVSFWNDWVEVKYLPHLVRPDEILSRISRLGYHPSLSPGSALEAGERRDRLLRLGISSILTANVMMISFALYGGFFQDFSADVIGYLSYPIAAMATPVVFYGGWPVLRKGAAGLWHRVPTIESFIAIGILSAYGYSLFQMTRGSLHLYFDTAAMLIVLYLLGRSIEMHVRKKATQGITDLYRLARQKVRLRREGKELWVPADTVPPGEEVLALAGERIPLDGRVVEGKAHVDESFLTGESKPVGKKPGDEVFAGSLLLDQELTLRSTRPARENFIHQTIRLLEAALQGKNPVELLADRLTRIFVPAVTALALIAAAVLLLGGFSYEEAFLRSVTILVIACPCALGVATPLAKVAAVGVARSRGILIREPAALEKGKDLDIMVFDKTGTLTEGNFVLREVVTTEGGKDEALRRVAAVETQSDHFLAKEIRRNSPAASSEVEEIEGFEELPGLGVSGRVRGMGVAVGNREFMEKENLRLSRTMEEKASAHEACGETVVFFGWQGRVQGFLVFGDSLKAGVSDLMERLRARRITPWLVSGDGEGTTRRVAAQVGIPDFQGRALPQDKVEIIQRLQRQGHRVGMVGDGINDAAALAQAEVGLAIGPEVNIANETADAILLGKDPRRVIDFLDLSAGASKIIRQNLFFSFFYNGLAIPLAVAGLLNPIIAVLAMFVSSLTVIGNTLRIRRKE